MSDFDGPTKFCRGCNSELGEWVNECPYCRFNYNLSEEEQVKPDPIPLTPEERTARSMESIQHDVSCCLFIVLIFLLLFFLGAIPLGFVVIGK